MSGTTGLLPLLLPLFLVVFVALWFAVTCLLMRMSGWAELQAVYPDRDERPLGRSRMPSAQIGGKFGIPVAFNGCLTIDACDSGVRFRVWKFLVRSRSRSSCLGRIFPPKPAGESSSTAHDFA